jgi:eukaryotic-like serine/threonine-protein kinase
MPHAPDFSGVALDGRYELLAVIGEGSFGRVYRGRDRRLARLVAVKVIKPWWAEDPEWVISFEREAQLHASISHPGIVQIFDVGFAPEGLYYVAELVGGESLDVRLRRGRVTVSEAHDVAEQLASALAQAHEQRVVHRDVKPANVLIAPDGRVKLGDFGVARLAEGSSDPATVLGTPRYMAPEQAQGRRTSPATDVYGMGVVLYEMLAGQAPFTGTSAVELALCHLHDEPPPLPRAVPLSLALIVDRALEKDPADRYPDGRAMALALAEARGPLALAEARCAPTRIDEPVYPRRDVNPAKRRRGAALVALALLIALGIVAAALAMAPDQVSVPQLHGMRRRLIAAVSGHLSLRVVFGSRYSQAAPGTAIAQIPRAGARVGEGTIVRVTLSRGARPVTVPRVVGSSAYDARATLSGVKLRAGVTDVPAPGVAAGTVTRQSPPAGASLRPGSEVAVSVAEAPRLRGLTSLAGVGGGHSVPFRILGSRWQISATMSYQGTCTFIFVCSGPSATVTNTSTGATVDQFDLAEGSGQPRMIDSGPGTYRIAISPGSDSARWAVKVDDYY